jgi:mannose-6-phosphate isomerase-like protein (cupin superfamily)
MLPAGSTYENPRNGARLEVLEMTPDVLRFRRLLRPHTGKADPHFHEDCAQRFDVLEGIARVEIDGEERDLGDGESVEVPIPTPHRDPYNPFDADALVEFTLQPVPGFIEAYTEVYAHLFSRGDLNDQDELPLLQVLVIAKATDGRSFTTRAPVAIQKATLPLLAAIGRMRGYRPSY